MKMDDFEVKINGEVCPPRLRDIILIGMSHQAGITGLTFSEVLNSYLKELGA
jgi:hypothetical protein